MTDEIKEKNLEEQSSSLISISTDTSSTLEIFDKKIKAIRQKITSLNQRFDSLNKNLKEYEKKLQRSDSWMIGIVIFFAITFLTTIVLTALDSMKDKELYSNYNNTYKSLLDKSIEQDLKIKDLENNLQVLKAKNYLK
jgi:peptidoglycan hydrolase CwlO-like protein